MPTINTTQDTITFISTYEISPDNLLPLKSHLIDVVETLMNKPDGCLCASIHESLDGKHLTVYSQWKSLSHLQAMQGNSEAQLLLKRANDLALSSLPKMFKAVHCQ